MVRAVMLPLAMAVLLLTVGVDAWARIGETPRECEVRYGRPVRLSEGGDLATYRAGRLAVVVHFGGGVADMVSYRRLPIATSPESHQPARPLTAEDVETYLAENGRGGPWTAVESGDRARTWTLDGGRVVARWDIAGDSLTLYTREFALTAGL